VLSGLPSTGTWTLTGTPGGTTYFDTGTSYTVTGLSSGTYTFTATNAEGCISTASANVIIDTQSETPSAPVVGEITQPTCEVATGSVVLSGLPATGTWTLAGTPSGTTYSGTGTGFTVTGLSPGTYTFTVSNAEGCISAASDNVVIDPLPVNAAPIASDVKILGTARVGQQLTGSYLYSDAEGDPEGSSLYQWFRNDFPLPEATSLTYTLIEEDNGSEIKFEVTPVAQTGTSPGEAVQSAGKDVKPRQYTLIITVNPSEGGTTFPEPGTYQYDEGDMIEIAGIPYECYLLESWTGDVSEQDSIAAEVKMDNDKTISVNFKVNSFSPAFNEELPADFKAECSLIASAEILTANDYFGESAYVTFSEERTDGICENYFQLRRTWIAEDVCGNQTVHIQIVNVEDNTPPVIICPPNIDVNYIEDIPDTLKSVEEYIENGGHVFDNCGLDEKSLDMVFEFTDITEESYVVTREYHISDLCGNNATCQQDITVLYPTSADKISNGSFKYSIAPNPNNGKFIFRMESMMDKDIDLKLVNMIGQIVDERRIQSFGLKRDEYFDISDLNKGIYHLLIMYGDIRQSEKIVIM
jgi:hypothetical protein